VLAAVRLGGTGSGGDGSRRPIKAWRRQILNRNKFWTFSA